MRASSVGLSTGSDGRRVGAIPPPPESPLRWARTPLSALVPELVPSTSVSWAPPLCRAQGDGGDQLLSPSCHTLVPTLLFQSSKITFCPHPQFYGCKSQGSEGSAGARGQTREAAELGDGLSPGSGTPGDTASSGLHKATQGQEGPRGCLEGRGRQAAQCRGRSQPNRGLQRTGAGRMLVAPLAQPHPDFGTSRSPGCTRPRTRWASTKAHSRSQNRIL